MAKVGEIYASLGFKQSTDSQENLKKFSQGVEKAREKAITMGGAVKNMNSSFMSVKGALLSAAGALGGITFGKGIIEHARDMQRLQGVFGKLTPMAEKFISILRKDYDIKDKNVLTETFIDLLKLGDKGEGALKRAFDLSKLTADISHKFGKAVPEVRRALMSAIGGTSFDEIYSIIGGDPIKAEKEFEVFKTTVLAIKGRQARLLAQFNFVKNLVPVKEAQGFYQRSDNIVKSYNSMVANIETISSKLKGKLEGRLKPIIDFFDDLTKIISGSDKSINVMANSITALTAAITALTVALTAFAFFMPIFKVFKLLKPVGGVLSGAGKKAGGVIGKEISKASPTIGAGLKSFGQKVVAFFKGAPKKGTAGAEAITKPGSILKGTDRFPHSDKYKSIPAKESFEKIFSDLLKSESKSLSELGKLSLGALGFLTVGDHVLRNANTNPALTSKTSSPAGDSSINQSRAPNKVINNNQTNNVNVTVSPSSGDAEEISKKIEEKVTSALDQANKNLIHSEQFNRVS